MVARRPWRGVRRPATIAPVPAADRLGRRVFRLAAPWALVATCACGSTDPPGSPSAGRADATAPKAQTDTALARHLPPRHRDLRARYGPHVLAIDATIHLEAPEGGPEHTVHVEDHVEVAWRPDALSLLHRNDHDRSHEMRVVGKRVFTRLAHRPWYETPLETRAHERWLDEAAAFPTDALALFAPALSLVHDDGDERHAHVEATGEPTHEGLRIRHAEGRLDAPEGGPLTFSLSVSFERPAEGAEPRLEGRLAVEATLTPRPAEAIAVAIPQDARPFPDKRRLDQDRAFLLDGLAAH